MKIIRIPQITARLRQLMASLRFARQVHLLRHSGAFDDPWYRAAYPESAGWDPVVHFLAIGAQNGYRPHALFDAQWWLEARASRCHSNAFIDYLTASERWTLSPSPYLAVKSGLDPASFARFSSPLGLYRSSGGMAGLITIPLFDASFYATNNPDVVAAGFDPLLHFITNGGREGRSPCDSFDAFWYLSVNADVKARQEEPLRHFLMRGARQGRVPHRAIAPTMLMAASQSSDLAQALSHYQADGRHRLGAHTHPRLPPPGAIAPLLDDWPWKNATIPSVRGRQVVILAGPQSRAAIEALAQITGGQTGAEPWLVALEPTADPVLDMFAVPMLSISHEGPGALRSLLRAAAFAGPHLTVAIVAPPEHAAHILAAGQHGLVVRPLFPRPALAIPRAAASISVVVPSYNHGAFLDRRLTSILEQRRAPCEVIVIDDASQDDSLARARAFAATATVPVRVIARERNSGSPFSAWEEGARMARGDLLWIAESDDVADPRLLERLAPFLEREERAVLAYCQSAAIGQQDERLADDHLFYTDDIDIQRWEKPYLVSGEAEITQALAIKNTIPNVSAALFRRRDLADVTPAILRYRYCGDWRAYLLLAMRGWIGFSPEPLNRTRRHGQNATLQGERSSLALREARDIRLSLLRRSDLPTATIKASYAQHQRELRAQRERHGGGEFAGFLSLPTDVAVK